MIRSILLGCIMLLALPSCVGYDTEFIAAANALAEAKADDALDIYIKTCNKIPISTASRQDDLNLVRGLYYACPDACRLFHTWAKAFDIFLPSTMKAC